MNGTTPTIGAIPIVDLTDIATQLIGVSHLMMLSKLSILERVNMNFEDDYQAWKFLQSRGYEQTKGVIKYREDKKGCMPEDESAAINYLFNEWDWLYL